MRRGTAGAAVALGALLGAGPAGAAVIEIGPSDDLASAIADLDPGDELVLAGGTYTLEFRLAIEKVGTAAQPIVIRSADGQVAHLTRDASQNVINIANSAYVELRGLEISGGSHGVRLEASSFITVRDCEIHDTGDVGLSANVPGGMYEGLTILYNDIHDTAGTGEGMYLGCNDNACTMFDSLIAGNHVHHTNGPDVSQGDGIEVKDGSYGNVIRDNVIHDTNYPCILVYGGGGNGVNTIERNALWGCGDHGIQAAADAIIRNNLVLGAVGNGIHSQDHQSATPGNLTIVHNTVVVANDAIRINAPTASVLIANNALYAGNAALTLAGADTSAFYTVAGNLGTGVAPGVATGFDASGDAATDFVDVATRNVFPAVDSPLIGAGDSAHVAADDFNGTPRDGEPDVGAYRWDATGNPGWVVTEAPKEELPGTLPGSGGTGGTSAAGGTSAVGGSSATGGGTTAAGGTGAGGTPGAAGQSTTNGASDDDGGCSCRTAPGAPPAGGLLALLAFGLFSRRQVRRARSRAPRP